MSVKGQLFSLFYLFYTLLQFSIFSKKEHKIFYQTFLFLLFSQKKSYKKSNANLFCSYRIIFSFFEQFRLIIEHNKLEVFYFSKETKNYNPSLFDWGPSGRPLLWPKNNWRYLGLIFDRKLSFCYHIYFYSNKALSTTKSMKILGNSTRRLSISHKQLLYSMCVIPITLYGF